MRHLQCPVVRVEAVAHGIVVLTFCSPELACSARPGQFINIKVQDGFFPLLRRPFSIYRIEEENISIIFSIVGIGTSILASKRPGDILDLIGPLGVSFDSGSEFETAILVAGGLGVAPLPFLTDALRSGVHVVTLLGARTGNQLVLNFLENVLCATDDGSAGFHGTVVSLLEEQFRFQSYPKPKIFGCGPNRMLENLMRVAGELDIPCEVSLESVMACGIGICQGCPVERNDGDKKYSLICKEGPVFSSRQIRLAL